MQTQKPLSKQLSAGVTPASLSKPGSAEGVREERYRIIRQIGEGYYTEVYLVEGERTGKQYALKLLCQGLSGSATKLTQQARIKQAHQMMYQGGQQFESEFKKEARLLKQFNHPHIVKMIHAKVDDETAASTLVGSFSTLKLETSGKKHERNRSGESSKSNNSSNGSNPEEVVQRPTGPIIDLAQSKYIVMEWAENGDLFDFVLGVKEPMGEELSKHFFQQILTAVEYLHLEQKIIHRDFKLENILVDLNFNLKICDFTLSKTFAEGSMVGVFYSHVGTERYMAPEILEGKPYKGSTTDIFALGVMLFVMVTGVMPFQERAAKTDLLYQYIFKNDEKGYWEALNKTYNQQQFDGQYPKSYTQQPLQWNFNSAFSEDFRKLIFQFFTYHYFERITLDKIRQSKWLSTPPSLNQEAVHKEMTRRKQIIEDKQKAATASALSFLQHKYSKVQQKPPQQM